jgi:tetratricopeptide (TPR) repeat protein
MRRSSHALLACLLFVWGVASASERSELLYSRGLVLFHAGKYEAALELFDRSVEANPADPYARYYRGVTRGRLGNLDGAITDLEAALERKPDLNETALELGVILVEKGRYAEATSRLEQAQKVESLEPSASLFLGLAELRLGNLEAATESFRRAARDPALEVSASYYQGVVAYQRGEWAEVEERFSAVVEASPESDLGREAAQFLGVVRARRAESRLIYGKLSLEYDSNLALSPTGQVLEETVTRKEDGRVAMTAGGTYAPWRTETMLVALGYDVFQSLHFTETDFNLQSHRPNVQLVARRGRVGYGSMASYNYYRLASYSFLQEVQAAPWVTLNDTPFGRFELSYRMRFNDYFDSSFNGTIFEGDDFTIRDSINHAVGLRQIVELGAPDRYAILGYRFDNESPRHSDTSSQRFGYDGNQVSGGVGWRFPGDIVTEAVYAYRHERYYVASAEDESGRRLDNEHLVTAVAYRQLTSQLRASCAFFGTINDSNQSEFQYQRYIGALALEVAF